jgi:hypothetical protein
MPKADTARFVVCIDNGNHPASLERRKIYVVVSDPASEGHGLLRVIDESGEDYLYPAELFGPVAVSQSVMKELLAAA